MMVDIITVHQDHVSKTGKTFEFRYARVTFSSQLNINRSISFVGRRVRSYSASPLTTCHSEY